jgi:hypothetical protein
MAKEYYLQAIWDPEAKVYYSKTNVPGLVVEAETLDDFIAIANELTPELLRANVPAPSKRRQSSGRAPALSRVRFTAHAELAFACG